MSLSGNLVSLADMIIRIRTVSPSLPPPSPSRLWPLWFIQWEGGSGGRAEGRAGQQGSCSAQRHSLTWRHLSDFSFRVLEFFVFIWWIIFSLKNSWKMIKTMIQQAKKHPGVGCITSCIWYNSLTFYYSYVGLINWWYCNICYATF